MDWETWLGEAQQHEFPFPGSTNHCIDQPSKNQTEYFIHDVHDHGWIQPARIVRGNDDIDKDEIRDDCDNIDDHQAGREEEGGGSSDSDWVGISEVFHSIIIWIWFWVPSHGQPALILTNKMTFSFSHAFTHRKHYPRSDISEGGRSSRLRNPEFAAKHKVRFLTKKKWDFVQRSRWDFFISELFQICLTYYVQLSLCSIWLLISTTLSASCAQNSLHLFCIWQQWIYKCICQKHNSVFVTIVARHRTCASWCQDCPQCPDCTLSHSPTISRMTISKHVWKWVLLDTRKLQLARWYFFQTTSFLYLK